MSAKKSDVETLRTVLEQIQNPEVLDLHPWVSRSFVQDAIASLGLQHAKPGRQLIGAIELIFSKMMPATPPRRGKRLDTRWGEFGILAARYFASLRFGVPAPGSLREAWGRIDDAILLYVFGHDASQLEADQVNAYKLVADELEVAPNSTLSDWHRNGLQELADQLQARDRYLTDQPALPATGQVMNKNKPTRKFSWRVFLFVLLGIFAIVVLGGLKARQVYKQVLLVQQDALQLKSLASSSANATTTEQIKQVGPAFTTLQKDFGTLKNEVQPFLWMRYFFGWVPVYGGDIASSQDLFTAADSMLNSAGISYQAVQPLVNELGGSPGQSKFTITQITNMLIQAQPQLQQAQDELSKAVTARSRMDPTRLSPRLRGIVLNDLDPLIALMQDGLTAGVELPRMLGATDEGPKTYLLLAENSDELRPTGGFITSAGTVLLQNGKIVNLDFHNTGELDNWVLPYPTAPWQLNQYMGSPVLILRDSNWFTNYPQAALYAEDLYSYHSGSSVNGVIAFDQQLLVNILGAVGTIQVDCSPDPINSGNLISFMRGTKFTPSNQPSECWKKDIYTGQIANALMSKILSGDVPWKKLVEVLIQSLNEHHLLIKVDDPVLTSFLASRGWDGVVRPGGGDFLMVVDSNIGFNKTSAVVKTNLTYDVDLTNPSAPVGKLDVTHQNNAASVPCIPGPHTMVADFGETYFEEHYPIDRCYWDYLRVYKTAGTQLLSATPQSIPAEWMLLNQPVPAKVDVLDEGIPGVQAFGTLKIVPGGQYVTSSFQFALPASVLKSQGNSNQIDYHLRIQKQPGTLAVPISISVQLPKNATVQKMPSGGIIQGQTLQIQTNLQVDLDLDVVFSLP
jgi:hypothetical protein